MGKAHLKVRLNHSNRFEQAASCVGQKNPERIRAKCGAKRQHQKIDDREAERQDAPGRMTTTKQNARADVDATPHEGNDAHHRERGRGHTRGKPDRSAIRSEENRQRSRGQQQQRDADQHRQCAPERVENREDVDVPFHLAAGRRADEHAQLDARG